VATRYYSDAPSSSSKSTEQRIDTSQWTERSAGSDKSFVVTRPIPVREQEDTEKLRARLLYQSRKRGIKENDLIMGTFAHENLKSFNEEELQQYDIILNEHDNEWDMYAWMVGRVPLPEYLAEMSVMQRLVVFAKNTDKEMRIELPPLY